MADWVVGGAAAAANRVFGVEDGLEGLDSGIGTGHFGAFRGVDEHKAVDAVVSVGKLEFPDEIVEDFAICDSYDKPRREGEVRPAFKGDESNPKAPETRRLRRRHGLRDGGRRGPGGAPKPSSRMGRAHVSIALRRPVSVREIRSERIAPVTANPDTTSPAITSTSVNATSETRSGT